MKTQKRITVSTADWNVGDWPDKLRHCISVELTKAEKHGGPAVEFVLDEDKLEAAVKVIAKEAIEAFFATGIYFSLEKDGLHIDDDLGETIATIEYDGLEISRLGSDEKIKQACSLFGRDPDDYFEPAA
jgi:hypothetical protein